MFPTEWTGVYEYDYNPALDSTPEPVIFRLRFHFSTATDFTGQVYDDPNSPMPEPGTISGMLIGNKIEFVKQMPKATYIDTDGGSLKFDCAHPEIYYSGEYIPEENLMVGTWHFAPISSGIMECSVGVGTWHADAVTGAAEF